MMLLSTRRRGAIIRSIAFSGSKVYPSSARIHTSRRPLERINFPIATARCSATHHPFFTFSQSRSPSPHRTLSTISTAPPPTSSFTTGSPNPPPWFTSLLQSSSLNLKPSTIIHHNPSVSTLITDALRYEHGSRLTSTGALSALSGSKTGRSPSDKRIVNEERHHGNVWWGPVNVEVPMDSFAASRQRALDYLETKDRLYVVDAFAGWDPKYRLKVRVVSSRPYHALFMTNMLIRPTSEELSTFGEPEFTIYNAGEFPANVMTKGVSSRTSVQLSFDRGEMIILGTEYAGEMKKGVFTVMHYLMPLNNVLSLHTSANEGMEKKDVSLFFGLSGTGKTTLSADTNRRLIGDDEHCWTDTGVFNVEGGCYAKAIDLSALKEPEIYNAIRYGSVLENVIMDDNGVVDYSSAAITENTRACYPISYIPNAKIPCVASHPQNIILLTCDAFGVLPPVAKLTTEQTMYHFISGYTAKVAGTEQGITEPAATFSACFGAPFLVWHPMKYAEMLAERLEKYKANVWLVNTGWTGGKYGVGERIDLKYSRAIIDAIHSGALLESLSTHPVRKLPIFKLQIPSTGVPGVPDSILDPSQAWASQDAYMAELKKLAMLFQKNFSRFTDVKNVLRMQKILNAGPVVQQHDES
ncbi:Protein kinase C-like 1 [Chytridiales sp. JEL 0842]|nr:Protein kinase C-like 1 [Chytridiales sp. JEL 0842]